MEGRKGRVKFRRAVTTVFEIANGPPSGPLRRYYGFGVPPTEAEKQQLCAKLLQALLVFLFSKQIGSPNVGKWTLLGPSLDGVAKGHWSFDIYGATFRLAFDKLKFKQLSSSLAGLSVGLLEDTCWSEVAGKVAANALAFLSEKRRMVKCTCVALALEAVRMIMRLLFALTRKRGHGWTPAMCILSNREESPIVVILQYYSCFLSEESVPRAQLLWRLLGCSDVAEMYANHLDVVEILGDELLLCASWVHRHHWVRLQAWPFPLTVLGDKHARKELQFDIAREWWFADLRMLDPYFGKRLRQSGLVAHWEELVEQDTWGDFFYCWASVIEPTNAQVEFRNARYDRISAAKSTQVSTFVAKALHAEASHIHEEDRRLMRRLHQPTEVQPNALQDGRAPKKGIGAEQRFHHLVSTRQRELGFQGKTTTKPFWQYVHDEYKSPANAMLRDIAVREAEETQLNAKALKFKVPRRQKAPPIQDSVSDAAEQDEETMVQCSDALVADGRDQRQGLLEFVPLALVCGNSSCHEDILGKPLENICSTLREPSHYPLALPFCGKESLHNGSFNETWKAWKAMSGNAPKAKDVSSFPTQVMYKEARGPIDEAADSPAIVAVYKCLLEDMQLLLKQHGKPCVTMRILIERPDAMMSFYSRVCSWLPAAGNFKFRCNLAELQYEMLDGGNVRVSLNRKPRVDVSKMRNDPRCAPARRSPFDSGNLGALIHETEDVLAGKITRLAEGEGGVRDISLATVKIMICSCSRLLFDSWHIASADLQGICMKSLTAAQATARQQKKRKDNRNQDNCLSPLIAESPGEAKRRREDESGTDELAYLLGQILDEGERGLAEQILKEEDFDDVEAQEAQEAPGEEAEGGGESDDGEDEGGVEEAGNSDAVAVEVAYEAQVVEKRVTAFEDIRLLSWEEAQWSLALEARKAGDKKWTIHDMLSTPQTLLGDLTVTFRDTAVKAVCRIHGSDCACILSKKIPLGISLEQARVDLMLWLGAGVHCDRAAHDMLKDRIRVDVHHMNIRRD
jgi:hypothetical protein